MMQPTSMSGRQTRFARVSTLPSKRLDVPSEDLRSTPATSPSSGSAQEWSSRLSSPSSLSTGSLSSPCSLLKFSYESVEPDLEFNEQIVNVAKEGLERLCNHHEIPESHGLGHALRVLEHAKLALLAAQTPVSESRQLAIQLAALLHDADDRKYFPEGPTGGYQNARRLAEAAGAPADTIDDMLKMIRLVSTSSNGNSVPLEAISEPEILWPRWADRLEAIGERGVVRCWQYGHEISRPLFDASTPLPLTEADVWSFATDERFAEYQARTRTSTSMLDHYYNVLLSVARPPMHAVNNLYLEAEFKRGSAPLVNTCLQYGLTSTVDEDSIRAMADRI